MTYYSLESDLGQVTHQILPERIRRTPGTDAAKAEVISWLGDVTELYGPQKDDEDNFIYEFYLNPDLGVFYIMSGNLPAVMGVIDVNTGRYLKQDFSQTPEEIALDGEVLDLLRVITQSAQLDNEAKRRQTT